MLMISDPAAASCPPTVSLGGDPELTGEIGALLRADGVATEPAAGCSSTEVRVARSGRAITVAITGAGGRVVERTVDRTTIAAALVESWVKRDELIAPGAPPKVRPDLAIGSRFTAAGDGSLWVGVSAAGRVPVGPAAVGAFVDVRRDTATAGDFDVKQSHRTGGAFILDIVWPIGAFAPWAGLGATWDHVTRDVEGTTYVLDRGSPALAAGATLSLPAHGRFAVTVELSATWAPLADTSLLHESAGAYFPGEPAFLFGVGVGLELRP